MLNLWKSHIFRCPPGPPSPKTLQKPLRIQARGPLWLQHLHLRAREERLDTTLQRRNVGVVFEVPRPGLIMVLPRCRWRHWGDPLDHKKVQKKRKWHWKIWKSAWFWSRLSCKTESKGCVYILKCCRHVDVSKWDAQSVYNQHLLVAISLQWQDSSHSNQCQSVSLLPCPTRRWRIPPLCHRSTSAKSPQIRILPSNLTACQKKKQVQYIENTWLVQIRANECQRAQWTWTMTWFPTMVLQHFPPLGLIWKPRDTLPSSILVRICKLDFGRLCVIPFRIDHGGGLSYRHITSSMTLVRQTGNSPTFQIHSWGVPTTLDICHCNWYIKNCKNAQKL